MECAELFCTLECSGHMLKHKIEVFKFNDDKFFVYKFDYTKKEKVLEIIDKKEFKELLRNFKKVDETDNHKYDFKIIFKQYEDIKI